jgi:hypothetical protein
MTEKLIWTLGLAVAAIPVACLGRANARAVPIGALLIALYLGGTFGVLGTAGAAIGQPGKGSELLLKLVVTLAVLAGLALGSFVLIEGPIDVRMRWTGISLAAWIGSAAIAYVTYGRVEDLHHRQANEEYMAPIRAAAARARELRAELDREPQRRRGAIDEALRALEPLAAESDETVQRFLVFGDPIAAPESVTVWGVLQMRPWRQWSAFGYHGERLHAQLNRLLQLRGYPARVALGFAPAAAVDSAGGDSVYFGGGAIDLIPQYLPDNVITNIPRPLELPARRVSP